MHPLAKRGPQRRNRAGEAIALLVDRSHQHALAAAQGADEARGQEIVILDLRKVTSVCDYFVICEGRSNTHVHTIAERIQETMKRLKIPCHHREGRAQATWIVLDYFDVVVHVFSNEAREFYALERLWGDAARVQFAPEAAGGSD